MVESDTQRHADDNRLHDEIRSLDSHILSLTVQTEPSISIPQDDNVETRAGMTLGAIANLLTHS